MTTTTEIPIWVAGKQLWVSGVDRNTTVSDIVETLLGHPDKQYSIIEKWRRVERPLNSDTRILKLWKTWGDAKTEVKLSLKKVPATTENDSGRSSPVSTTGRRKHRHKSACVKHSQTVHPRRLAQLSKTQNIERLLKLILVQGETIQNQILRLKERESQIEDIEREQHENRVNVLGTNYLLETYLGCSEEKEDSGVATELPSSENTSTPTGEDSKDEEITIEEDVECEIRDIQERIHLFEKIAKTNKKMKKVEENLVRLFINIERCKKSDSVMGELQSSLEKLRCENEESEKEVKQNAKKLTELECTLSSRKLYLKQLEQEVTTNAETTTNLVVHVKKSATCAITTSTSPDNEGGECERDYCSLPNRQKPVLDTLV